MIAELGAIQAAANGLKSAGEILKTLKSAALTAEMQGKVIELQSVILSAQSDAMIAQASQMELLDRVRKLEGDLKRFEDWEAEKQRYVMAQTTGVASGVLVYALKQSAMKPGEIAHAICPSCYEAGKKSILQASNTRSHFCPACKVNLMYDRIRAPT